MLASTEYVTWLSGDRGNLIIYHQSDIDGDSLLTVLALAHRAPATWVLNAPQQTQLSRVNTEHSTQSQMLSQLSKVVAISPFSATDSVQVYSRFLTRAGLQRPCGQVLTFGLLCWSSSELPALRPAHARTPIHMVSRRGEVCRFSDPGQCAKPPNTLGLQVGRRPDLNDPTQHDEAGIQDASLH